MKQPSVYGAAWVIVLLIFSLCLAACEDSEEEPKAGDGGEGDLEADLSDADPELERAAEAEAPPEGDGGGEIVSDVDEPATEADGDADPDREREHEAEAPTGGDGEEIPADGDGEGDCTDADEGEAEEMEAAERPLYWHDGRFVRDKNGRAVIFRGINVSNHYKSAVDYEPDYIGEAGFENVAASGFNAVRLVTEWYGIEPEPGVYDETYLDLVAQRVGWATAAGLYVIIDLHQDIFGIGFNANGAPAWACDESYYESYEPVSPWFNNYFSEEVTACFDAFWQDEGLQQHHHEAARALAGRVADDPLVVGFDPFNEPFWGSFQPGEFERDHLWPFYLNFARVVGEAIPQRLFFIEPCVMFNVFSTTELPGPVDAFNAVFAPHYYNGSVELEQLWDGNAAMVAEAVGGAVTAAEDLGLPWAYGEMGGATRTPNFGEYLLVLYEALDMRMAGSFLWDYSTSRGGFGVIDTDTGEWTPHAYAFLRPAPSAVAGTPETFFWDYAALRFSLSWDEDPAAGDTEIILPAWVARVGYEVKLDGAAVQPVTNGGGTRLIVPGGVGGRRIVELTANGPYEGR